MATTALTKTQTKTKAGIAGLSVIAADYTRYPGEETQLRIRIDAIAAKPEDQIAFEAEPNDRWQDASGRAVLPIRNLQLYGDVVRGGCLSTT